jgi:hypothetical protein
MTPYEKLYELNMRLQTARYRLEKAEKRVKSLEKQISDLVNNPRSDDGWDVT